MKLDATGPWGAGRSRVRMASLALVLSAGIAFGGAEARVDVTLDMDTLNSILAEAGPSRLEARTPIGPLGILLSDMRVTGFDPAAGNPGSGWILASFRLRIPQVGLDTRVEPRLSLEMIERGGSKQCALKFERAAVELERLGHLDLASLLPRIVLTPDVAWTMETGDGEKEVRPRLVEARVGAKNIRLSFDLDIGRPEGAARGGTSPSK